MTDITKSHKLLDTAFNISVILKGLDGLIQLIGGVLLLLIKPELINKIIIALTQHELSEDPKDIIANHLLKIATHTTGTQLFGGMYLLLHGLIKIFLVIALIKRLAWAYPVTIIFLFLFIIYQIYRITLTHSIGLTLLSVFDVLMIWLVWQEYKVSFQANPLSD